MMISKFFSLLGAPLKNTRWSWGAVRHDGTVILKAAQQDFQRDLLWVANVLPNDSDLGDTERLEHTKLAMRGARCYAVSCEVVQDKNGVDKVASFGRDQLLQIGEFFEEDGRIYGRIIGRVSVNELIFSGSS